MAGEQKRKHWDPTGHYRGRYWDGYRAGVVGGIIVGVVGLATAFGLLLRWSP